MGKFSAMAMERTTGSRVTAGRTKVSCEELMRMYPHVTVVGFDIINGKKGEYPALLIKEDNTVFFFGGTVMMDICNSWLHEYDGDIDKCNEDLAQEGVKMSFGTTRTKNGNNCTTVTIID